MLGPCGGPPSSFKNSGRLFTKLDILYISFCEIKGEKGSKTITLKEMIVDIENKGEYLKVSTFSEEGDLIFIDVPVPEDQRFIWEKVRPGDRKAKLRSSDGLRRYSLPLAKFF